MNQPLMQMNIYPYCNCHARGRFERQDGYTYDPPSGFWVHSRCHKPSRMNYERNVLGLPQIPQVSKMTDIYEIERRYEARKEIEVELDWDNDDDEDY